MDNGRWTMAEEKIPFFGRAALWIENAIMTRLVPKDRPGVVFKWLFKIPIIFYKVGLPLFGGFILLLTTTGRKTGKPRYTPLEYHAEDVSGYFIIMAGWGGKTDWMKNILADARVHAQAGRRRFDAIAEKMTDEEVAAWLYKATQVNPSSLKIWSRWAGEPLDGSLESMKKAAPHFPCFRLVPRSLRSG
jgi:deazaflavin-dependent oxidoreductase (nitroreductase family)